MSSPERKSAGIRRDLEMYYGVVCIVLNVLKWTAQDGCGITRQGYGLSSKIFFQKE